MQNVNLRERESKREKTGSKMLALRGMLEYFIPRGVTVHFIPRWRP